MVTDRRVLFVSAASVEAGSDADAGSLAYSDLAAAGTDGADVLALSTTEGVRWEIPVPDTDRDVVDAAVRHLSWIGDLRARVVACRNDVELAAGEIRDHAEAMEWDQAREVYETTRGRLDRLVAALLVTGPVEADAVAPGLTGIERTLEGAYARLYIERAGSQLELAGQLVDNGDYEQTWKVLETAQEYHDRASERAETVRRGDDFRFGRQRELRDALDHVAWEIEAVAAEPLRQAHEAKIQAETLPDPAAALDHWEAAFRRYRTILELETDDRTFVGNRDAIREDACRAAARLVDGHRERARQQWNEGVTLARNDAVESALDACAEARGYLDRAAELAAEYRPGDLEAIESGRDGVARALSGLRETAESESPGDATADTTGDPDADTSATATSRTNTVPDIRDIDTHQEITFDATVERRAEKGQPQPGRVRGEDASGQDAGDEEAEQDRPETVVGAEDRD